MCFATICNKSILFRRTFLPVSVWAAVLPGSSRRKNRGDSIGSGGAAFGSGGFSGRQRFRRAFRKVTVRAGWFSDRRQFRRGLTAARTDFRRAVWGGRCFEAATVRTKQLCSESRRFRRAFGAAAVLAACKRILCRHFSQHSLLNFSLLRLRTLFPYRALSDCRIQRRRSPSLQKKFRERRKTKSRAPPSTAPERIRTFLCLKKPPINLQKIKNQGGFEKNRPFFVFFYFCHRLFQNYSRLQTAFYAFGPFATHCRPIVRFFGDRFLYRPAIFSPYPMEASGRVHSSRTDEITLSLCSAGSAENAPALSETPL